MSAKVRELQIELQQLRKHVQRTSRNILIGVAVLIVVLGTIGYAVARLTGLIGDVPEQVADVKEGVKKVEQTVQEESRKAIDEIRKLYEDPDVLVGKLKSHIRARSDEQIAELRNSDPQNWQRIGEVEKQRDQQLDSVEQLVMTIREGLSGDPDPIFAEAARILAEQGVEEAIKFLESKQPEIEERVNALESRRNQAEQELRAALEPWLLQGELQQTNLAWDKALELYEKAVEKAPQWSRARSQLGFLMITLGSAIQRRNSTSSRRPNLPKTTPTYLDLVGDCTHSVQLGDLGDDEAYTEIESQVDSAAHRFFAGNHDHYHCLPVHSLGDFGEVTLGGVAFFFVRGAASMDKAKLLETGKRIGRQLWLAEEELRDDQMSAARQEYSAAKPQIMISHDAPTRIARFVCQETSRGEAEFVSSRTSDFLETLLETHRPKLWLFGHYHHDWEYAEFGTHFRCVGELSFVDIDPNGQLVGCASRQ